MGKLKYHLFSIINPAKLATPKRYKIQVTKLLLNQFPKSLRGSNIIKMKVLVLLQILAFLAISINADSVCIKTKGIKKLDICTGVEGFKVSINYSDDGNTLTSICFTGKTKKSEEKDCLVDLNIKKSDITYMEVTHDTNEENNVTK